MCKCVTVADKRWFITYDNLSSVNTIEMGALGSVFASKIKELDVDSACKLTCILNSPLVM